MNRELLGWWDVAVVVPGYDGAWLWWGMARMGCNCSGAGSWRGVAMVGCGYGFEVGGRGGGTYKSVWSGMNKVV